MSNEQIYAPNIHLFAFQVAHSLISDKKDKTFDNQWLQVKYQDILTQFHLELDLPLKNNILPYTRLDLLDHPQGETSLPIDIVIPLEHEGEKNLKGRVYPLWIQDSYGLGLNIRYPQGVGVDEVDIDDLKNFNPMGCFSRQTIQSNLGQTVLITGFLNQDQQRKKTKELRELADQCYRIFTGQMESSLSDVQAFSGETSGHKIPFHQRGKLFGSPIYEYGIPGNSDPHGHILIWFFFAEETSENFMDCYGDLMDLFFYRSKIIQSYENSQADYQKGMQIYADLERYIDELKGYSNSTVLNQKELQDLKLKLKYLLQIALQYSQILRNLEDNYNCIKINTENYQDQVGQILHRLQKLGHWRNLDMVFLEQFYQQDCPKYQAQIQAHLFYLRHGLQLLDQAIATIRGITEIDHAERDRALQTLIAVLGVGVGTGIIFAATSTHPPVPGAGQPPPRSEYPVWQGFLSSLFVSVIFASLTYLYHRGRQKRE